MSYDSVLSALSPTGRWKLDDLSGSTATAAVGSNGSYVGTTPPTLGVTGLVSDGGTAVNPTVSTGQLISVPVSSLGTSGWLAFWASTVQTGTTVIMFRDSTSTNGWFINVGGTNIAVRISGTDHTTSTLSSSVKDGARHFFVLQTSGTTVTLFIDGTQVDSWARTANFSTLLTPLRFGQNGTALQYYNITYDDISIGSGTLTGTNVSDLWTAGTATGGVTGTLATTLAGAALAASGGETMTGTLATTLGGATLAASASERFTGTLASTLAGATLAASGSSLNGITGTLATTLAGATLAASGAETITGTLTTTLAGATLSAAGSETFTGTLTATLSGATLSASGVETVTGSLAVTLAGVSLNASGGEAVTGTLTVTLDGATLAGTGTSYVNVTGTLAATLAGATLNADANTHAPFRDVKVFTIVDRSRVVTITDQSRVLTPVDHPREIVLTDRSL